MLLAEKPAKVHRRATEVGRRSSSTQRREGRPCSHEQGVPFEVVPGARRRRASAHAGVPITYPGGDDVVVLVRGRGQTTALPDVDWDAIVALTGRSSLRTRGFAQMLGALVDHGASTTRRRSSTGHAAEPAGPSRRHDRGTLRHLSETTADAAILVGQVARCGTAVGMTAPALLRRRIVVTRSQSSRNSLSRRTSARRRSRRRRSGWRRPRRWIARPRPSTTSSGCCSPANSVARFFAALAAARGIFARWATRRCAIGPSTADRLAAHGIKPT